MSETALYRPYDAGGRLLYVGIATDPEKRMNGHQRDHWYADIAAMHITLYPDRRQAKTAESEAVKTEWPLWNVAESPWGDVAAWYAWRLRRKQQLAWEECSAANAWPQLSDDEREEDDAHYFHVRRLTSEAFRQARREFWRAA